MSKGFTSYRIGNQNGLHYLTIATVNWIDVFSGKKYRDVLIDSLAYCPPLIVGCKTKKQNR
jgi:hypothetical protein